MIVLSAPAPQPISAAPPRVGAAAPLGRLVAPLLVALALCIGAWLPSGAHAATGAADKRVPASYTVKGGDTLWTVAQRYDLDIADLRKLNRLRTDVIKPGQTLRLKAGSPKASKPKAGGGKAAAAQGKTSAKAAPLQKSSAKSGKAAKGQKVYYKVKKGDTLSTIAKKHRTSVAALRKLNGRAAKSLRPGRALVVAVQAPGSGPERVVKATQLPESGPGYRAPRRDRVWGTPTAIKAIQTACAAVARLYPGTVPVFVGDISLKGGGYMPPHKSHRTGIDADISYFTVGNGGERFGQVTASTLDAEKTWSLFQAFLDTGKVDSIYVDYRLQKPLFEEAKRRGLSQKALDRIFEYPAPRGSGRSNVIRHIRGHADHFHIRFVPEPRPDKS